eukprot:12311655-Alexandrium_andersonii.AAC.1
MSKWAGQYCFTDPVRSNDTAREQMFTLEDIKERAARGEVPGGGPGRKMLRPGVWKPQFRTEFPPEAAHVDDQ